ncbi:MAG TPA: GNAT family N-acetyltransferase [Actinomycetota bacterium]|jgi:predicted GNAT family acetyltransferase|nr:GNAT family N-acetyltransferase [Actinomycetota bacterium]
MTSVIEEARLLDNVVWHAIDGPLSALAERVGQAGRFHAEVGPFAAIADNSPDAWNDLATLVGAGKGTVLFAPTVEVAQGWVREHTIPCFQMIARDVAAPRSDFDFVELEPSDVDDMLGLIQETQPGPFGPRTIEFGRYIGYKVDGRLVAMAGERLRCRGFTEVSAVCTAIDYRGRGLAGALTLAVVRHIRARGDEAFLHVASTNENAHRLYLALGFVDRVEAEAVIVRNEGSG